MPDGPAGAGETRHEQIVAYDVLADRLDILEPNFDAAHQQRNGKKRGDAEDVAPANSTATKPDYKQQDDRKRRDGALGQHGG